MDIQCQEVSGGWRSSVIPGTGPDAVKFNHLWAELVEKVYHPDRYLPVTNASTRANADGSIWRSMDVGSGPTGPARTIREDVYLDKANGTVKFVVLDDKGMPTPEVHYNIIHTVEGGFVIEYVDIDAVTGERKPLKATAAIQKQVQNARRRAKANLAAEVVLGMIGAAAAGGFVVMGLRNSVRATKALKRQLDKGRSRGRAMAPALAVLVGMAAASAGILNVLRSISPKH